jgi:hypothetical protein
LHGWREQERISPSRFSDEVVEGCNVATEPANVVEFDDILFLNFLDLNEGIL